MTIDVPPLSCDFCFVFCSFLVGLLAAERGREEVSMQFFLEFTANGNKQKNRKIPGTRTTTAVAVNVIPYCY